LTCVNGRTGAAMLKRLDWAMRINRVAGFSCLKCLVRFRELLMDFFRYRGISTLYPIGLLLLYRRIQLTLVHSYHQQTNSLFPT
jgi:hypothetical protein